MPLRSFTDPEGHKWEVWEAHVRAADRRILADRRSVKRTTFERRIRALLGIFLGAQRGSGWLVFQSVLGKWRLSPVPDQWEHLTLDAAGNVRAHPPGRLRRTARCWVFDRGGRHSCRGVQGSPHIRVPSVFQLWLALHCSGK